MPKRERDEAVEARLQHMRRTIVSIATTSEAYEEMSSRYRPWCPGRNAMARRELDRKYVEELAKMEAAKEPDDPTKVEWNWFCRIIPRDGWWDCAIKHIKGRAEHEDIKRVGAEGHHTWNKVVILLNHANVETRDAGLAVNWIRDTILPQEFVKIKEMQAAKSRKGVARQASRIFGTKQETLSKDGFMVKKDFVTKKDLATLEAMSLEYLPTNQSG
jgi:hypothetical protein